MYENTCRMPASPCVAGFLRVIYGQFLKEYAGIICCIIKVPFIRLGVAKYSRDPGHKRIQSALILHLDEKTLLSFDIYRIVELIPID